MECEGLGGGQHSAPQATGGRECGAAGPTPLLAMCLDLEARTGQCQQTSPETVPRPERGHQIGEWTSWDYREGEALGQFAEKMTMSPTRAEAAGMRGEAAKREPGRQYQGGGTWVTAPTRAAQLPRPRERALDDE